MEWSLSLTLLQRTPPPSGVCFQQPALLLGALFGRAGFKGATHRSLQHQFRTWGTLVAAVLFYTVVAAAVYVLNVVVPSLETDSLTGVVFPSMAVFLGLLLAVSGLAIGHGFRDPDYQTIEDPSPSFNLTAKNTVVILLLLVSFTQLFALSYHPEVPFPISGGEREAENVTRLALNDFGDSYTPSFAVMVAILGMWALVGANLGYTLAGDKSIAIRAFFPFLGRTFVDFFVLDLSIPLLTNAAFLPVVNTAFRALDCTWAPAAGVYVMDAAPDVPCWEGTHLAYATVAVVGLSYYSITATMLGVMFLEVRGVLASWWVSGMYCVRARVFGVCCGACVFSLCV